MKNAHSIFEFQIPGTYLGIVKHLRRRVFLPRIPLCLLILLSSIELFYSKYVSEYRKSSDERPPKSRKYENTWVFNRGFTASSASLF